MKLRNFRIIFTALINSVWEYEFSPTVKIPSFHFSQFSISSESF